MIPMHGFRHFPQPLCRLARAPGSERDAWDFLSLSVAFLSGQESLFMP